MATVFYEKPFFLIFINYFYNSKTYFFNFFTHGQHVTSYFSSLRFQKIKFEAKICNQLKNIRIGPKIIQKLLPIFEGRFFQSVFSAFSIHKKLQSFGRWVVVLFRTCMPNFRTLWSFIKNHLISDLRMSKRTRLSQTGFIGRNFHRI